MIVRVQSAELSGVQRFVLRLLGDRGRGTGRIGGVALLGGALPRPRRRSAVEIDLLVWTAYGCTLVVLADFGSVQHGVLETPPDGRWQIDDRAADLRTGSGTVNPLARGRKQRAELEAVFRRHGLPGHVDVLVVLIPKTGSRITWSAPPQEAGDETIMVRIGQSASLPEYFERPPAGAVRWRATDIAQAFETLGIPLSTPDTDELAAEGFAVAGNGSAVGTLTAPGPAARTRPARKLTFPGFAGAGRTSTRQGGGASELAGPAGPEPADEPRAEQQLTATGTGPAFAGPASSRRHDTDGAPVFPERTGFEPAEEFRTEAPFSAIGSGPVPSQDGRAAHDGAARAESSGWQPSLGAVGQPDIPSGRTGAAALRRAQAPDASARESVDPDRKTNDRQSIVPARSVVAGRPDPGAQQPPDAETADRSAPPGQLALPDRLAAWDQPAGPGRSPEREQPAVPGRSPERDQLAAPGRLAEQGRSVDLGRPGEPDRLVAQDKPGQQDRRAELGRPAQPDMPEQLGNPGRSREPDQSGNLDRPGESDRPAEPVSGVSGRPRRAAEHSVRSSPAVASTRLPRQPGVAGLGDRHGGARRAATPAAEGPPDPISAAAGAGVPKRGDDSTVPAGEFARGGEVAVPDRPAADPVGSSVPGTSARKPWRTMRTPAGVSRGFVRLRQVPARARRRVVTGRPVGNPSGPEHGRPADVVRPAGTNTGGRGARYAIAVGVAGAALAAVTGTVFAASGFARFDVAEYGALCQGEGGTTVAAPYAASGPSPIHLAGELSEFTPAGPAAVWHPVDARSVQLVACVSEVGLGELVRTCQFPPAPGQPVGRTLNLFAMAYRLSVYEARTGNRLAAIDLTGERFAVDPAGTDTDVCRAATGAPEDGLPGRRHSRLSQQQVQRALASFANPEAPQLRAAR